MINSDDLLNEETSHIVKSVNDSVKKEQTEIPYKIRLIITIVLGCLIMYAGIYTLYYVYFAPGEENEIGDVVDADDLVDLANEKIYKVPYYMGENVVYNDYGATYFSDVDTDVLVTHIIDNLDDEDYVDVYSCNEESVCVDIYKEKIVDKFYEYYGEVIDTFADELTLSNGGVCILSEEGYACDYIVANSYTGKVSVIEAAKETEEYFYIYETALFVSNLVLEDYNMTFDYIAKKPSIATAIAQDSVFTVDTLDYVTELYNLYEVDSFLYKHTFKIVDGDYYWEATQIVNSITE